MAIMAITALAIFAERLKIEFSQPNQNDRQFVHRKCVGKETEWRRNGEISHSNVRHWCRSSNYLPDCNRRSNACQNYSAYRYGAPAESPVTSLRLVTLVTALRSPVKLFDPLDVRRSVHADGGDKLAGENGSLANSLCKNLAA